VSVSVDDGVQSGNVVAQVAMSLDGFIAGPGHSMDWVFEFTTPEDVPDLIQATGAMLSGRWLPGDGGEHLGSAGSAIRPLRPRWPALGITA
jgi:hypothetical protein